MPLQIFNTLTRQKEVFEPLVPGQVSMYVCGVTVYDDAHVGHAMSSIVFDVMRRYLEYQGHRVCFVKNFTDVDDKIIRRANERGEDPLALSRRYSERFLEELDMLNVKAADVAPRVSEEMPEIISMIQGLIDKGHAYASNGDVYFRRASFPAYGRLSRRPLDEMNQGEAAVDLKQDPTDFALWKGAKPGEPYWDSPWGPGRPGWHIECSAMAMHHLGEQVDIHGGGTDLVFPHHENEIAQSEAYTGHAPFARYWVHNGMVQMENQKMSKSLGNVITVRDFLKAHTADALRFFSLSSHYRIPRNYTPDAIDAAEKGLTRIHSALRPARQAPLSPPNVGGTGGPQTQSPELDQATQAARENFETAMNDDFNTSSALAALFELVTAINRARDQGVTGASFAASQATLRELLTVLGFTLETAEGTDIAAAPFIELLLRIRADLRKAKQFALADQIRQELTALGVQLEDSPTGTTWRRG